MELNKLHGVLFDILCTVDKICRDNNIFYVMDSGTLLGAVRHGDFIPWDDDIDLIVRWDELPKLKAAMKADLPPHLHLLTPEDNSRDSFHDFGIRIYDDRYFWDESEEGSDAGVSVYDHVCIDLLPLVNAPDSVFGRKLLILKIKILYGLCLGHRHPLFIGNLPYSLLQVMEMCVLSTAGKLIPLNQLIMKTKKMLDRYERKGNLYCVKPTVPLHCLMADYRREWFNQTVSLPFRGKQFPVPSAYHAHLVHMYGENYLIPERNQDIYVVHNKN